jgi:HAMP domain-containing protein
MRLLVKFNLIYVLVMALGIGACALFTRSLLQDDARQQVLDQARLLIDKALAVRGYTSGQITQLLETQMQYEFLAQAVPSYSATEVLHALQQKYPDFFYKEATLNPTNPRDRASGWEVDVVNQFRNSADLKEFVGERDTPTGRSLYVARPLQITNGACLVCHSSVEAAPRTMIEKYGPANGFGWQMNEVVGAQIVSVPMALPLQRADRAFGVLMGAIVAVFVVVGIVLNAMIWFVVVRPVTRLSALADRVSQGDLEAPEFTTGSKDEIGVLAQSFSRMRMSIVQAMKMLDT